MKDAFQKERSKPKELVRTFHMEICKNLFMYRKWAQDVIKGIENDRLLVLNSHDVFSMDSQEDSINLDSGFNRPVSIKEWLPIACQYICIEDGKLDVVDSPDAIAFYRSNAGEVLFPSRDDFMPPGPAAFFGKIVFKEDFIRELSLGKEPMGEDKFKFILAHELTHVIYFLRILVPAFENWKRFWEVNLDGGSACDEMSRYWGYRNIFIDNYGTEDELQMISEFWPKKAKKWFDAFRRQDLISDISKPPKLYS